MTSDMFEVPGSRLRELGEAERERDELQAALAAAERRAEEAEAIAHNNVEAVAQARAERGEAERLLAIARSALERIQGWAVGTKSSNMAREALAQLEAQGGSE